MKTVEGLLDASNLRIAIVCGRWNSLVGERLIEGAVDAVVRHRGQTNNLTIVRIPGSFELPLVCKKLAISSKYDGIIALGVLLKGETDHYEHVAASMVSGITQVIQETGVPVGFGVITGSSLEQALDRAGGKAGNKGWETGVAVIEMANLLKALGDS